MGSRKTMIVLAVLVGVLLLAGGLAYDYYRDSDYHKAFPQANPVENNETDNVVESDYRQDITSDGTLVYILLLGIDRDDERDKTMGVYRTDTIAVARLDLVDMRVRVLSIPRDTYTYVPIEDKYDKINHAYAYGSLRGAGTEESIKAVNHLLGKPVINNYVLMDMEPIPAIVDEIGGVKVDVDMDIKESGTSIAKGIQVLNGEQSEVYLRWRNSSGGDIDRIKHQQTFMGALFKQQRDSGKLLETVQVVLKYRESVKTDLTLKQVIALSRYLADLPADSVEYMIIPGNAQMIKGVSYWVMDKDETKGVIQDFFK